MRTRINELTRWSLICLTSVIFSAFSAEKSEIWKIDNLERIGGYSVTVFGDPEVVKTDIGKAVKFDGDGDMLLVDFNPIGNARAFTVEVIFKQDASYPHNTAPRFIHIQDPGDEDEKRLMIELRITEENLCYLDGFLNTDSENLTLIDENLEHPTEQWLHAAIVYSNGVMTTYMNGVKELRGEVGFTETLINPNGKVAIGGRMNHVAWFSGLVKTLKVTHMAIEPGDFMHLDKDSS